MKMRYILLAIVALFAIGPIASHADDGLRVVAITAARITTALGYAPLNPANNLSEVATPATARTNLGLGTAATVNTGTSGATVPLLNAANTFSAQQTMAAGLALGAGNITGVGAGNITIGGGATGLFADANNIALRAPNGAVYLQSASGATNFGVFGLNGVNTLFLPTQINGNLGIQKQSAVPSTAPGSANLTLTVVAGTNSGTCKLVAQAGTSTTPVTIADNIGAGC